MKSAIMKKAFPLFFGVILLIVVVELGCQSSATAPGSAQTPAATQEDFHFSGAIESISAGNWVIGGQTFKVDANTRLDSGLAVGVTARVEYIVLSDGTKLAREIQTP